MRKKEREIADKTEIELIIQSADVCRIAIAVENVPYIVTMNFGYSGEDKKCIFFHCANDGRKIDMLRKNNYVCFELDTDHILVKGDKACDFTMKYRSVVGYGYISVIDDEAEKIKGLNCLMSHYSDNSLFTFNRELLKKTTVLCLEITEISGKSC